jgi:hypothetical protein
MTVVQLSEQDLRRLHQVQLEMLRDLDRVCRLLGVEYQLGAGSLLGAIRHGGFIPWDYDVDVVMLRADYRRFLREAPPLLEQRLFLQTWRSDPHFHAGFAKLRCHGSSFREQGCQHTRQHHGIFIDIFPFDPVCPGRWWGRILLALVVWMRKIIDLAGDVGSARLTGGRTSWRLQLRSILHRGLALVPFPFWMAVQAGSRQACRLSGQWSALQEAVQAPGTAGDGVPSNPDAGLRGFVAARHSFLSRSAHTSLRRLHAPATSRAEDAAASGGGVSLAAVGERSAARPIFGRYPTIG